MYDNSLSKNRRENVLFSRRTIFMWDNDFLGLDEKQVEINRKKYGSNNIDTKSKNSFKSFLLEALGDPIIKILLLALGIKLVFLVKDFDWFETLGIMIAIFVATSISALSEYGSEKAFNKMQEEALDLKAKVKRGGKLKEIAASDVVKDDIIVLHSGDKVVADGHIVKGEVGLDEANLSGESKEIFKEEIKNINGIIQEKNKVYRGSVVISKSAIMKVDAVGKDTVYGKIAHELTIKTVDSPLKVRLTKLATLISKIGYIGAFLVSFSYLFSEFVIKNNFDMSLIMESLSNVPYLLNHLLYALTLCVTVIVVAVPEGLPMMITLVLSSNMKRMLKDNVLVRKLTGIETAGSINLLFTDKTGTLTKGKLEVVGIYSGGLREYLSETELKRNPQFYETVKTCIIGSSESEMDETGHVFGGNITDQALRKFISDKVKIKKISSVSFDSKNKYSIARIDDGNTYNVIKGASEVLLPKCNSYVNDQGIVTSLLDKRRIEEKITSLTKRGMRVLLLAKYSGDINNISNLTLVGIICIKDEIRKEAKDALKIVNGAGINTVMITGDNKETALAIAKDLDLVHDKRDIVLTSYELSLLSDEEIKNILGRLKVVARSLPQDKSRLVRVAQEEGLVVGMTGDGVNDSPALKRADVGFSMGSGSEVSKEASDIVILDDNFLSISKAILFGRTIFKSIRKFIIVQLTINFCAITLSIICPFIGIETPVTVIQMLWVNMVMDTLAGLAFAFEPPVMEYMEEKPKKKDESIINSYMISEIIFTGGYSAILCLLFLKLPMIRNLFRSSIDDIYLMTAFFGLFIFIDIFNSFNARTSRINILANILENKMFIIIMSFIVVVQVLLIYFGGDLFRTTGLNFKEFLIMLSFAFTVIPVDWIRKVFYKRYNPNSGV